MSKDYAVFHVGIGRKRYKPGDELPPLTDEMWKRLHAVGAIRSEHDPIETELEIADELENSSTGEMGEETQESETPDDAPQGEEAEDARDPAEDEDTQEETEEMPDINVMDGIDEEAPAPKKRGRKAGKA